MKIYIITKEPFPYGMAATNRIICYAKGLIANGAECEVLIVKRTEYWFGSNGNTELLGLYQNIPFRYIPNTLFRDKNLIKRKFIDLVDLFIFLRFCLKNINKNEIILNFTSSIFFEIITLYIARRLKTQIIRELCEYPYAPKKDSFIIRLNQKVIFNCIFPFYHGFIVISESLKSVAEQYKASKAIILKVPILIDTENIDSIEPFKSELPYVFHAGTLSEKKDAILSTIKAFGMAIRQLEIPIFFYMAGDDKSHWKEIQCLMQAYDLQDKLFFLGRLKHQEVLSYWEGASLAVLNKNDNMQNQYGFSTKLAEILLSETAVITTTVGEANYYLKDGISAYIVEPHNPELIAKKIVRAFTYPEERLRIARNGKEIARKEFDNIYHGKRILDLFKQLTIY